MKLPFHSVLGPILKRNQKAIKSFCSHSLLQISPAYVAVLGVLGAVLSFFDIVRIIRCGPILPGYYSKPRTHTGIVSPESERDLKLVCLVLSQEYYLFLLAGLLTHNPIFFLPFLVLYALIVTLEFFILVVRIFTEGLNFCKFNLIMSMFMIYNWLNVFCTFSHITTTCDY